MMYQRRLIRRALPVVQIVVTAIRHTDDSWTVRFGFRGKDEPLANVSVGRWDHLDDAELLEHVASTIREELELDAWRHDALEGPDAIEYVRRVETVDPF